MKKLVKSRAFNNVLSALAVAGFGFILLNITFIFDFLFQSLADGIVNLFTPVDINMAWHFFPLVKHMIFVFIICLISLAIFKTRLDVLYKAIYMTVPSAVVFVTIGMFFSQWPIVGYSFGGLFGISVLYYFYRTKQPWLYYYAFVLVGVSLAAFTLMGGEI